MRKNQRRLKPFSTETLYQIVIYSVIALLLVISVFPLLYVLSMSLTSELEFNQRGNMMVIPYHPTLQGYKDILFSADNTYVRGLGISFARVLVGTTTRMICTMILGYIVSRKDMPGKNLLMGMVLITILYSGGTIPTFLTVDGVGLNNTFWAMIIPTLVDSWSVLVFKQFFTNIPGDVMEAADLDGASEFQKFVRVVLPMSKPVLASLGLFAAVAHWNSWFDAAIYLSKRHDLYPLQLILRNMLTNADLANDLVGMEVTQTSKSLRMTVVVVGTIPILCIYPFLQKHFTAGVYTGAVKE
jgi:putative aldouronate transport system permease protein